MCKKCGTVEERYFIEVPDIQNPDPKEGEFYDLVNNGNGTADVVRKGGVAASIAISSIQRAFQCFHKLKAKVLKVKDGKAKMEVRHDFVDVPDCPFEAKTFVHAALEGNRIRLWYDDKETWVQADSAITAFVNRTQLKGFVHEIVNGVAIVQIIRWADLHRHSGYSLLDGANHIHSLVDKTDFAGAITDHGVMFGVLEFYKQMNAVRKRPIIGFEAYVETIDGKKQGNHLLLLAKNRAGYKNLIKLSSYAYDNFYRKPHVSYTLLREYSEGIIATSACIGNEIPQRLLRNDYEGAKQVALTMIDIFGKEDFYIEIQRHGFVEEAKVNPQLIQLARELDLKIVAGIDSHYTNKEDAKDHEILLCIQTGKKVTDEDRMRFSGTGYHLHSALEVEALFRDLPEAIETTLEIAEKCDLDIELGKIYMPPFPCPEGFNETTYFEHLVWTGFDARFANTPKDNEVYRERVRYEIAVIKKMGFEGYFLIVWDFIDWAKRKGIMVGPGRGSVVGSLAAYCMKISDLDPIPYGLLFERFLNPERVSMPDIDIDFQDDRRDEVIEYVRYKYGVEAVSKIVTFGTMKAKAAVRDLARALDKPYAVGDKIAKAIPVHPKMTLKKAFDESPEFLKMYQSDPEVKEIVDIAMKFEGLPRHASQHACFDAETLVTTSNGLKRIVDIQKGELVLTHQNRFMPVVDTIQTETECVYTLKTTASFPVDVTGNHPLYVREMKRKRVRNSKEHTDRSVKQFGAPKWKSVSEIKVGDDYVGIPINQESKIPYYAELNLPFEKEDFWWLLGRYLGDGWTECHHRSQGNSTWDDHRVIICCSKKTNEEVLLIAEKLVSLGFPHRIEESNTTIKIYLTDNKSIYQYLQGFGRFAFGKYVHEDVFHLPRHLIDSFIQGYLSADGCFHQGEQKYSFKTVSKSLAIGMMQLIAKAYHRQTNVVFIPAKTEIIEGRQVESREKYSVYFSPNKRNKERSFYEDGYIWSRVSSIQVRQESKVMYNLTVLNDSSYVAQGLCAHNCGIVIAPSAINNYLPEMLVENGDGIKERTAQYVMTEVEESGLLKMDFLGLRTMTVIDKTLGFVNEVRKIDFKPPLEYLDIPLNDKRVYQDIARGESYGVFQLESPGMRSFMKELMLDAEDTKEGTMELFERLIAGVSLYRPGPMDSIPEYIKNMRSPDYIEYDAPVLETILSNTYGKVVYQEQVMQIVRDMGGYSLGRSDLVRRAMGKKKAEVMAKEKNYFINGKNHADGSVDVMGCVRNGIPYVVAEKIWDIMAKFAEYAFNKSHAAAYAMISIITAYLKYYYPVEYMTAILNSYITNADKLKMYLSVCKKMKIEILPPDVNKSRQLFSVDGGRIRFGLQGIKNLGKASENIIDERKQGPYKDYQDLAERMAKHSKIDKRIMEAMVYAGAVDSFEGTRRSKLEVLTKVLSMAAEEKKMHNSGQMDLFEMFEELQVYKKIPMPNLPEFDKKYKLEKEKEYAGFYVTEHPLDDYVDYFVREGVYEIGFIKHEEEGEHPDEMEFSSKQNYDGHIVKMAGIIKDLKVFYTKRDQKPIHVFNLEDKTGDIKAVVFADRIELNQDKLHEGKVVMIQGQIKVDDFDTQIIVRNIFDIEAIVKSEKPKCVWVKTDDKVKLEKLFSFVKENRGELPVYFLHEKKKYQVNDNFELNFSNFSKLQDWFGNNVKVVYH